MWDGRIVWDSHACIIPHADPHKYLNELSIYDEAGVTALGVNLGDLDVPLDEILRLGGAISAHIQEHSDRCMQIRSVSDVDVAAREGKLGIFFNVEGLYSIGDNLHLLSLLQYIGVRWMLFVYNSRNLAGSGVLDDEDLGLTEFGRAAAAELDRVGIIKCCSHTGYRTAMDVLTSTDKPTIFSHSNPRALLSHPRNIPDELIRACAGTGGVVCLNGVGVFLGDNDIRPATLARHVDYVANLVGPEFVGLGLDLCRNIPLHRAGDSPVEHGEGVTHTSVLSTEFFDPRDLPLLVGELTKLGWRQPELNGLLGLNMRRVAQAVWKPASEFEGR